MLYKVPATLVFSFFVALLLNQEFKGRGFVRAIFFLPVILSSGVIVGLEYNNTLLQGMEDVVKESGSNFEYYGRRYRPVLDSGRHGLKIFRLCV